MIQSRSDIPESRTRIPDNLDRPAPWSQTALALGPFLLLPGIFWLGLILPSFFESLNHPSFGISFFLAVIGIFLVALLVGWVRGFPRWVFPYWGFVLLISLFLLQFRGTISGAEFTGSWRVWIPILGVVIIGLFFTRNLQPAYQLLYSIWKDWTLLSFTFYGALPLFLVVVFEGVHHSEWIEVLLWLVLTTGALLYMRSTNTRQRAASLMAGFLLTWLALMIHQAIYWNGRQEDWMDEPASWMDSINSNSHFGVMAFFILLAPVLIQVILSVIRSRRIPGSLSSENTLEK